MSMRADTLLIEIGVEELPPRTAKNLSDTFSRQIAAQLARAGFNYHQVSPYVTPRRLAVSITGVSAQQPDQNIERKGPALSAAYDDNGQATKAALGFAESCGVAVHDLDIITLDKGRYLYFKSSAAGKPLAQVAPEIIQQALHTLPIARPMRWGDHADEFVRPVHWVTVMYGAGVLACRIKTRTAANTTRGHRFHANAEIRLKHANDYQHRLMQARVIADFNQRKNKIEALLRACAQKNNARLHYDQALLEEVTNLVEWPVAIVGRFSPAFLDIPQQALVVTMQDTQRYFPMFGRQDGKLLAAFITIANIDSHRPDTIRHGNERVIKPRFEDARFFWQRDKQRSLESRRQDLKGILFTGRLGSLFDKSQRIADLCQSLCRQINIDDTHAVRTAQLCKADLLTDMVKEFPRLQGIMGRYYAQHDNEPAPVAQAIEEHYQPLQSGAALPASQTGKVVAICDRIDSLVGIFASGKKPSGVKDPYALRRAALGVIRIAIEGAIDFDLTALLNAAADRLKSQLDTAGTDKQVLDFIYERLRGYFMEQGIKADTFAAVCRLRPAHLTDFAERIKAVQHFRGLAAAGSLAAANKRIGNILKKADIDGLTVETARLQTQAEKQLHRQVAAIKQVISAKFAAREYTQALSELAQLRPAIDRFFDDVMVMHADPAIRNNRIGLLLEVNRLFTMIADISLLQLQSQ